MVSKVDKDMHRINLQEKTKARKGTVEAYWFENELTGLDYTCFHRITIPLTKFYTGLEFDPNIVLTEIVFDWLVLDLDDPRNLDKLMICDANYPKLETSVYIGGRHNWCNVQELSINQKSAFLYAVVGKLIIDFEAEGVSQNESFCFETTIKFIE
jgi:hypothetical protein